METRYYHGNFTPNDFAKPLVSHFNRGNIRTQTFEDNESVVVQIASHQHAKSGGQTAITLSIEKVIDGVSIRIGKQSWLGIAASLGKTAMIAWRNPLGLLDRLDDLAQDIEYLKITEDIWNVIEKTANNLDAKFDFSERLNRLVCIYCHTSNTYGEPNCIACGAPLGHTQPTACDNCGFVIKPNENICPNCSK